MTAPFVFPSAGEQLLEGAIPVVSTKGTSLRGSPVTIDVDGNVTLPSGADLILPAGSSVLGLVMTTETTYYIDSVLGNDSTGTGLSSDSPVATFAKLWTLVSKLLAAPLNIQMLSAGNYPWSMPPKFVQLTDNARVMFYAPPSTEILTATLTCASGTDETKIVVTGPLTVNEYQHHQLEVVDGPAAGFRRSCMSNTATDVIPCVRYENLTGVATSVTPVAGNTVRVFRPGVVITGISTAGTTMFADIGRGDAVAPLVLINVALTDIAQVKISNCTVYMAGVEFRAITTGRSFQFEDCRGSLGSWSHHQAFYTQALPSGAFDGGTANIAKGSWFGSLGLSTDVQMLARWRGYGVTHPSSTSTTTGTFTIVGCRMSMHGTWPNLYIEQSVMQLGGYHWGSVSVAESTIYPTGRGTWNNNIAAACVYRAQVALQRARWFSWANEQHEAIVTLSYQSMYFLAAQQSTLTPASGSALTVADNSVMHLGGVTIANNSTSASVALSTGGRVNAAGTVVITNSGSGPALTVDIGCTYDQIGGTAAITAATGGVAVAQGGSADFSGSIAGPLVVSGNATHTRGNLTLAATSADVLTAKNGGVFTQGATRTLSAVATTSGRGALAASNGKLNLVGGASTTITGIANGLVVEGGSAAWFNGGDPTGVTATSGASNALKTGILASVANSAVAGVGSATGDAYGNVIGRAA